MTQKIILVNPKNNPLINNPPPQNGETNSINSSNFLSVLGHFVGLALKELIFCVMYIPAMFVYL